MFKYLPICIQNFYFDWNSWYVPPSTRKAAFLFNIDIQCRVSLSSPIAFTIQDWSSIGLLEILFNFDF